MKHPSRCAGVALAEQATMRVAGELPVRTQSSIHRRGTSLTFPEESHRFQFDRQCNCERIVDLRHIDLLGPDPGALKRLFSRPLASELDQRRRRADVLVSVPLASA